MKTGTASVALAALFLLSVPAAAQSPPVDKDEPAWKTNKRRHDLAQEGEAFAQQGQWAKARESFLKAVAIRSHPRTLLWIGFCEEQLGHPVGAKTAYDQARLDARAGKLKAEERDATEQLSKLEPTIPQLAIHVPADVVAKVWLDDVLIDARAEAVSLDPGRHTVRATAPEREDFTRIVDIKPGGSRRVVVVELPLVVGPGPIPPKEDEQQTPPPSNTGPIVLGVSGLGVAVLGGVSIGVGVKGNDKPSLVAGGTMLAFGVGAGVGALVWGLQNNGAPKSRQSGQTTIAVAPLPGGGWAAVQGSF
jgi:hypothetical protein